MTQGEPEVLEMLVRHELAIKELYDIFAMKFTNRQAFWQSLAADEQKHADWLDAFRSKPAIIRLLHDTQLKPQAIKTSLAYVEKQLARAKGGNVSLLEALSMARDLENAALERLFVKLKMAAPKEIGATLADLATETERHRRTITEALNTERPPFSTRQ